ncbi:MAG: SDR family NAD(P)-dependent oxidoreductase [Actinomycetota bacterium]|nr:SDR family NAD(P)-dependent oxidoreductase [Actinomycetota bacterium]
MKKIALVTGGTSGIGLATVEALHRKGYIVVFTSSKSQVAGEQIASQDREALRYLQCDVTNKDQISSVKDTLVEHYGRLDVLINNAGYTEVVPHSNFEGATDELWMKIFTTNVMGTWWMSTLFHDLLKAEAGSIVNITSIAGLRPIGSSIPYSVSKAALNQMTRLLAASMDNVRVNAVAPGLIDTPWTESWDQLRENVRRVAPLHRSGTPEDVAQVVVSVAEAAYLTGEVIAVDGGLTLKV